ncbi:zinc finger protein 569-like [Phymastichus coffea]|uniref:zinc finger protein 569-like n=1 Tax=Phymastichus coffea TaxID=108790 RepID=UPI00273AACA5|nr:zinc finger protein 569-like [Phymastichus coffea]
MSLTNASRVSCLTCNLKVAINSTKNIYKTVFTQTGKSLASFVLSTLSLTTQNLRSPYLCLRCLSLFGKLDETSRKVKSIKCEIHKIFQDSCNSKINCHAMIKNAEKDTFTNGTNTQIPLTKPRAVITRCTQEKHPYILFQRKIINNNFKLPTNLENKKTNKAQSENDRSDVSQLNVKTYQENLKNAETNAELITKAISIDNDMFDLIPSLKDHQYTQLHEESNVFSCTAMKSISSTKVLSIMQQNIIPAPEPKKLEVTKLESYTCLNCGTKNNTMKDLKLHYKTHSEIYPYMCEKCGKVYKTKKSLKIHIKTHDRLITQYACTTCNKCFTLKSALKRHLLIHSRKKRYECEICLKKFLHHTSFMTHTLSHIQKKHKCHICAFTFTSSSNLKRHMRVHGGEKKHNCKICNKSFFEHYEVVSHMKVHDPEQNRLIEARKKYHRLTARRCERCKINFASAGEYNVHIRKHTPENLFCNENNFVHGIQLFEPITDDPVHQLNSKLK